MKMRSIILGTIFLLFIFASCNDNGGMVLPMPTCNDGIRNGNETGVDCGGGCTDCLIQIDAPNVGFESPTEYDDYTLVWNDEFNDDKIDAGKWSHNLGGGCPDLCGWGYDEQQYHTNDAQNSFQRDGYLVLNAVSELISGYAYSSARINTDDKYEFKYGRIDIRAAMPPAVGTRVAFFLLNKDFSILKPEVEWPSGGEIDVMEYLAEDTDHLLGKAHFGTDLTTNHKVHSGEYTAVAHPFDKAFYVFSIIWEEDRIQWLVNDMVYHEITPAITSAEGQPYPFNDEFFLSLSLSVGGSLTVEPISNQYPSYVIIDYVRVFQK